MKHLLEKCKENKYKLLVIGVVGIVMLAAFVVAGVRVHQRFSGEHYWYAIYAIFGIILLGSALLLLRKMISKSIEKIYLFMAILFGCAFMLVLPPYSMADEMCHIDTSYYYSSMILGKTALAEDGTVLYREEDMVYNNENHVPTSNSLKLLAENFFRMDHSTSYVSSGRKPLNILPVSYMPQIIGVTVARIFHLGNVLMLYMGRLFGMAFAIACFYLAIKITPIGKEIFMVIGLLPMTLEIVSSFSYDSLTIALSVLYTAYLMHLIFEAPRITWKHWGIIAIVIAWLTPAKVIYVCLAFTLLCIPKEKFEKTSYKYLGTMGVLAIGMAIVLATRLAHVTSIASGGSADLYGYETYTVSFFLSQPKALLKVVYATIEGEMATWIFGMLGQSLGWMEIMVPVHLMIGFIILLALAAVRTENEKVILGAGQRLWIFIVAIGISALVCVAMLLDITPLGSPTVLGVQGRYFLPVLPALLLLFKNQQIVKKEVMTKYISVGTYVLDYIVVLYVLGTVVGRV